MISNIFTLSTALICCSLTGSLAAQIGDFFVPPFEGAESAIESYTANINPLANIGWIQYVAGHDFTYPSSLSKWLASSTIFSYTNSEGLTSTMSKAYADFPKSEYIDVLRSQAFPTEQLAETKNPFSLFSQIIRDATAIVTTDPNGSTHTITFTSMSGAQSSNSITTVTTSGTSNAAQTSRSASSTETSSDNFSHALSSSNSMKLATLVFCIISFLLLVFL